ncbi:MAG: gliding motility-associated C-terminal domain-containing protein [Prevotellaceae bacterium]|nr:gliding motility-associated C-terminal domain-containing protein [Prevotellaceae bacterium]
MFAIFRLNAIIALILSLSLGITLGIDTAAAQCSFELETSVQNSRCMGDGTIRIKLNGIDPNNASATISLFNGNSELSGQAKSFDHTFNELPPDTYSYLINVTCDSKQLPVQTGTLTVSSSYTPPVIFVASHKTNSLNCKPSGLIPISVLNGKPPYSIRMTTYPPEYAGALNFSIDTLQTCEIGDLPAGNYEFSVMDACNYSQPLQTVIHKMSDDFPQDVFGNMSPHDCQSAYVTPNHIGGGGELAFYWNTYKSQYYDVIFVIGGKERVIPVTNNDPILIDLPALYLDMYNRHDSIDVHLRVRGTECRQLADKIALNAPNSLTNWITNIQCDHYDWVFDPANIAACSPYKWELFDADNDVVVEKGTCDNFADTLSGLLFNRHYRLAITDSKKQKFEYLEFRPGSPPEIGKVDRDNGCNFYSLTFPVTRVCFPYVKQLYNITDSVLVLTDTVAADEYDVKMILGYGKKYEIRIIDNVGVTSFEHGTEVFFPEDGKNPDPDSDIIISPTVGFKIEEDTSSFGCNTYAADLITLGVCPPFTVEINKGDSVTSIQGVDSVRDYKLFGLRYDTTYVVKIQYGGKTYSPRIRTAAPILGIPSKQSGYEGFDCYDYSFFFTPSNLFCLPYRWEVFDAEGKRVEAKSNITEVRKESVRLKYNEYYSLKITAGNDSTYTLGNIFRGANTYSPSFKIAAFADSCKNSNVGFIQISGTLDPETRIKFIEGPQRPPHADTVLKTAVKSIYPFSADLTRPLTAPIEYGNYSFEITDKCGKTRVLEVAYLNRFEVVDFAYTEEKVCGGPLKIHPSGMILRNGTPLDDVWYKIETPDGGSSTIYSRNPDAPAFELLYPGQYTLKIQRGNTGNCYFDSISVTFDNNPFMLSGRSSYVCEPNGTGKIHLRAKNGVLPYTYELLSVDSTLLDSNTHGMFEVGKQGETYIARITDACRASFSSSFKIISLDQATLIGGMSETCSGSKIELACMFFGVTDYLWTTPRGTTFDTQNIEIADADTADAGNYVLRILATGCLDYTYDTMSVDVVAVPPPAIADSFDYCLNAPAVAPSVEPLEGHDIRWYSDDGTLLDAAPSFETSSEGNTIYNVEQIHRRLGCTERKTVAVAVHPLPAIDFTASAGDICRGDFPEIVLKNLKTNCLYEIFPDSEPDSDTIATVAGRDSVTIAMNEPLDENASFYIRVTDSLSCRSPELLKVDVATVYPEIYPEIEMLPDYQQHKEYRQELYSNIARAVFSLDGGILPDGLILSPEGLIHGTAAVNVPHTQITVGVRDSKLGCTNTRIYLLNGETRIPKVFTPNGDGINDIFMEGHKVVIFDRLGIEIFRGDSGWDGSCKTKPAPVDIYFYKLYPDDKIKMTAGYVGLER